MIKPRVVISRCINIQPVRYNGGIVSDDFAKKLGEYVEYIDVCPEVDIGMPIPRPSVILAKIGEDIRIIEPLSRTDYTGDLENYSQSMMNRLSDIDGFLLKSKSPSCGVADTKLYKEDLKHTIGKTYGLFALRCKQHFPYLPVEDEGRVHDEWIKRDFLTKIFTFASFRYFLTNVKSIKELIDFHQNNKYLIMLYSPQKQKRLGQIIANWDKVGFYETVKEYKETFYRAFSKRPRLKNHINVIEHIYGHFSDLLKPQEKRHINILIDKTIDEKIKVSTLIEYIRGFVYRFDSYYLMYQTYLNPYPADLE